MMKLQKDSIELNVELEERMVQMVFPLLFHFDIQTRDSATNLLTQLINQVNEEQVETIVDLLYSDMYLNNAQLHKISSIGFGVLKNKLPSPSGSLPKICVRTINKLLRSIEEEHINTINMLSVLLGDFRADLTPVHGKIAHALLQRLSSTHSGVQKRTIGALAILMECCDTSTADFVMEQILESCETRDLELVRSNVEGLAEI